MLGSGITPQTTDLPLQVQKSILVFPVDPLGYTPIKDHSCYRQSIFEST